METIQGLHDRTSSPDTAHRWWFIYFFKKKSLSNYFLEPVESSSMKQLVVTELSVVCGRDETVKTPCEERQQLIPEYWMWFQQLFLKSLHAPNQCLTCVKPSSLPRQLNNHSQLRSPSHSNPHEGWLDRRPTSNDSVRTPHTEFKTLQLHYS